VARHLGLTINRGQGGGGGQGVVRIIWYGGRSFPNNHQ
tara:strand:+ start:353 stop:466 length:114 start_codon:yes stop_codon:yes gene_type:complete